MPILLLHHFGVTQSKANVQQSHNQLSVSVHCTLKTRVRHMQFSTALFDVSRPYFDRLVDPYGFLVPREAVEYVAPRDAGYSVKPEREREAFTEECRPTPGPCLTLGNRQALLNVGAAVSISGKKLCGRWPLCYRSDLDQLLGNCTIAGVCGWKSKSTVGGKKKN